MQENNYYEVGSSHIAPDGSRVECVLANEKELEQCCDLCAYRKRQSQCPLCCVNEREDETDVIFINHEISENVLDIIRDEYFRACSIHPDFSPNKEVGMSNITEEVGELSKAILEGTNDIEEAVHVAVTAIRYISQYKGKEEKR